MALEDRLGPLLGRAHEALRVRTQDALEPFGLTPKAFGALVVLADGGLLSQQQLAERQGIDRTTTVAVVDLLEDLGAVERRRAVDDRRAYSLHITPEGRRMIARAQGVVVDVEREFLAGLDTDEQRALKAALRVLVPPRAGS
jgi:DNA-binding MarR family transcriptional regulator